MSNQVNNYEILANTTQKYSFESHFKARLMGLSDYLAYRPIHPLCKTNKRTLFSQIDEQFIHLPQLRLTK